MSITIFDTCYDTSCTTICLLCIYTHVGAKRLRSELLVLFPRSLLLLAEIRQEMMDVIICHGIHWNTLELEILEYCVQLKERRCRKGEIKAT